MKCAKCGAEIVGNQCDYCGEIIQPETTANTFSKEENLHVNVHVNTNINVPFVSPKSRTVALLLCIFLGVLGGHRFYVGKVGTGLIWLVTGGFFGVGAIVDLVWICLGTFRDKEGLPVKSWS